MKTSEALQSAIEAHQDLYELHKADIGFEYTEGHKEKFIDLVDALRKEGEKIDPLSLKMYDQFNEEIYVLQHD